MGEKTPAFEGWGRDQEAKEYDEIWYACFSRPKKTVSYDKLHMEKSGAHPRGSLSDSINIIKTFCIVQYGFFGRNVLRFFF